MVNAKSEMKLLYVTPEKLSKSKRFMAKLQKSYSLGLFNRLAIDEVHCCSVWGHDFRPDYKVSMNHRDQYHIGAKIRNLSKNSQSQNLIFHKINDFKVSFFTKFTISKSHFSQNSHF